MLLVFSVMFFALAISSFLINHRWFVSLLWAVCGAVLLMTVVRRGGKRQPPAASAAKGPPEVPPNPQTRARRSGNPAVRAQAESTSDDDGPDRRR